MEFFTNINIIFYILGYLIGGIPFGYLLAKYYAKVDIQENGSGGIGATNVLRVVKEKDPVLGKKLSAITLGLDAFKGVFILLIASFMGLDDTVLWGIAILAIIGHCFSPYLKFEGGKGVAVALGIFLYMLPLETLIGAIAWGISAKVLKISSLSSLIGLIVIIISSFIIHPEIDVIKSHSPIIIIAFLIIYKHIPNIIRLFQGQETKSSLNV